MPQLGATFQLGQTFPEEGVFFRITNQGAPPLGVVPQGIVAVIARATWGPLNTATVIPSDLQVDQYAGSAGNTDLIHEAFAGNPQTLVWVRQGTGGTAAAFTVKLVDGTTSAVTIPLKYVGLRGNGFTQTLQDSLVDTTKRVWTLYESGTVRAQATFAKAPTTSGGHGEAGALVAAINALASPWLGTAALISTPADNSTLQTISSAAAPGTAGTAPTVDGTSLSNALTALQTVSFNTLVADVEDTTSFTTLQTYTDHENSIGHRFIAFVGEPTSVARSTRLTDVAALNDPHLVYVLNGGVEGTSGNREGMKAAARAAGMLAGLDITTSLTHEVITGWTSVLDPLTLEDYRLALAAGALVVRTNPSGQVTWGEAVDTYVTPDANHHASWARLRVVRIYDNLMDQVAASWAPLVGQLPNSPRGRRTLMNLASRIIANMTAADLLASGSIIEDPQNPPSGNNAWFVLTAQVVDELDGLYVTLNFPFSS